MKRKREMTHDVSLGPPVPLVPLSDFTKDRTSREEFEKAWRLCGPSVAENLRRHSNGQSLELWQVIASAYMEGLLHGAELTEQRLGKQKVKADE